MENAHNPFKVATFSGITSVVLNIRIILSPTNTTTYDYT